VSQEYDSKEKLIFTVQQILEFARTAGASSAEADIGTGGGLSVTARMGDVETIEHQRDKGLSVTVYLNKQKGNASTTDFSGSAIRSTVDAACTIARNAGTDEYAGLLDPEYLAVQVPDLDLYHPWEITPELAKDLVIDCEDRARGADSRISNSDGATLNTYTGTHIYGNSNGFIDGWNWSSHSIDCNVIAQQDGHMQRDGWYTKARDREDLSSAQDVALEAARRTVARLGARKLPTCNVPVIYEAPVASDLISSFISAVSGGAQYRKASFLLDKLDQRIFAAHVNIYERPHINKGIGSAPFDNDGMATSDRRLVTDGILQGYILSAYSARKLGMRPTGNAGGIHNLIVEHGSLDFNGMIKEMGTGLLVTELIGFGVNMVTGDYSRGACGFWIENGAVQYPVEEITIAGNLADMFNHISIIGNDVDRRKNILTGSILIDSMMVAGA